MSRKRWRAYVLGAAIALTVGSLSGLLSVKGMKVYNAEATKPPLSPPGWLFPAVWTVLYALMGTCAAIIWKSKPSRMRNIGLNLYAAQLIVNFFWSPLFFNARDYGLAAAWLVVLWILVLLMILTFRKSSLKAAWLQVPYLIWLTFAAYLNFAVWIFNR